MATKKQRTCPNCRGKRGRIVMTITQGRIINHWQTCGYCQGHGYVEIAPEAGLPAGERLEKTQPLL